MTNKYFTAFDGTTYIAKSHIENVILKTLDSLPNKRHCELFVKLLIKQLDACYYIEQIPEIANPDVDYFYCGSCRRGFPVKYKKEKVPFNCRPCPRCGASAVLTPKLDNEETTNEKDNTKGSRS